MSSRNGRDSQRVEKDGRLESEDAGPENRATNERARPRTVALCLGTLGKMSLASNETSSNFASCSEQTEKRHLERARRPVARHSASVGVLFRKINADQRQTANNVTALARRAPRVCLPGRNGLRGNRAMSEGDAMKSRGLTVPSAFFAQLTFLLMPHKTRSSNGTPTPFLGRL